MLKNILNESDRALKRNRKNKNKLPLIYEYPVTYEVYDGLPDDGNRYEVADGTLELMGSPTPTHQSVLTEILFVLNSGCRSEYLIYVAPIDVILSDTEVRQPDLVIIHRSRTSIIGKTAITGAPDLVVEIISPWSRKRDKVQKLRTYAKYSIPEYWIIDSSNWTLEQYVLADTSYELVEVYAEDEPVQSGRIRCASFTMNDISSKIPDSSGQ